MDSGTFSLITYLAYRRTKHAIVYSQTKSSHRKAIPYSLYYSVYLRAFPPFLSAFLSAIR